MDIRKLLERLNGTMSLKKYQYIITIQAVIISICFGLSWSVLSPTIPDLCMQMGIEYKEISASFSIRSFIMIGVAPVIGIAMSKLQQRNLVIGLVMVVLGITRIVIPFIGQVWFYTLVTLLEYMCYNSCEIALDTQLLQVWGGNADSAIQAWHMGFTVGFALGPVIVMPFLIENNEQISSLVPTNFTDSTIPSNLTMNVGSPESNVASPIHIPYIIIGVILIICSVASFVIHLLPLPKEMQHKKMPEEKNSLKDIIKCKEFGGKQSCGITVILLLISFHLFFFFAGGLGASYHTWLYSYARESSLDMSKKEAAMLDLGNKLALLVSRIACIPIVKWVSPPIMIFVEVFGTFVFMLPLIFTADTSKVCLWIFSVTFNLFMAPEWASGISWMDRYLPVTSTVMILVILAEALCLVVFQYLSGFLLSEYSPASLMYMFAIVAGGHCFVVIGMQIIANKHGVRHEQSIDVHPIYKGSTCIIHKSEIEQFLDNPKAKASEV